MASNKSAFIIFAIAFSQVASWTVDLPDIRKFMFNKYETHEENEEYVSDGREFSSNIEGNSLHHSEPGKEYDDKHYVNEHGYVSYMEKKVDGIVRNGGRYLEGLRRAIERYTQFLESCNNRNNSMTRNLTTWQPPMDSPPSMPDGQNMSSNFSYSNPPSFNFSQPSPPSFNFTGPGQNFSDFAMPRSSFNASNMSISCEEVSERSEQVRRLAQLAMWSTMRLQDLAYARKYQEIDEYEENELILKLAWFLDRLAYLTGYEPEPKKYLPSTTQRPTTVSPIPVTLVPAPEPIKTAMMDCLKENSSIPATERCRYPLPVPDIIRQITNTSEDSSTASTESMNVIPMQSDTIPQRSLELLITSEDNPFRNNPPFTRSKRHVDSEHDLNYMKSPSNRFLSVEYFKNHFTNSKSIVKSVSRVLNRDKSIVETDNRKSSTKLSTKVPVSRMSNEKSTNKKQINNKKSMIQSVSRVATNDKSFYSKKNHTELVSHVTTKHTLLANKKSTIQSVSRLSPIKKASLKSLNHNLSVKNIKKRSADDPMAKLLNYYPKYKAWDNSNPLNTKKNEFVSLPAHYDDENQIAQRKYVVKRSIFNKKESHIDLLTPLKNIRKFIKNKQSMNYHTYSIQKPKIVSHLESIRHQINLSLSKVDKVDLKPKNIRKRSLHYENMYLPRESENPMRDISYYVKNKDGREYNPSLAQAAQVRLGLEQIFQTGNIEVVRRYGSNYNPADPAPFYTGILRTMADS